MLADNPSDLGLPVIAIVEYCGLWDTINGVAVGGGEVFFKAIGYLGFFGRLPVADLDIMLGAVEFEDKAKVA